MRKTELMMILLVCFASFTGCGKKSWVQVDSKAGKYSALFPGKPTKTTKSVATLVGSLKLFMRMYETQNSAYMVAYSDYPKESIDQSDAEEMLDDIGKGIAEGRW